jgi:predicted Zn-dependent protease
VAAKPRQEPRKLEGLAMLKPGGATGIPRPPLDPTWSLPEVTRKWKDLSHLSPKDEMRLGADLHGLIMRFNPKVQSGPWLERVETAARPILANRSRKDIDYTFTVLDSDAVNAFSHPGGYIYVSRGLFPFLGEGEDAALKFVLAHEIAHVDQRHAIQCLEDPDLQKMDMGTLQEVYTLILPLGYMDKQEYVADRWAYQQLMRLDYTRYETLKFLRMLKGYAADHGFSDGRAPYIPGPRTSPVENHLRAHTAVWRRLNELEAFADPAAAKPR